MKKAVYPGSFDPVTLGHLDIIERASKLFDRLIVAVLKNESKAPLFTINERVELLQQVVGHLDNVEVISFEGLLVDFVKEYEAGAVVRGLRAVTDFEYEIQMAQTNKVLLPEIDTVFLTTNLKYSYLSSTIAKEVARFGGETKAFLPEYVREKIKEKYK
jgi:pantetheine-phosphate adenylyltransferase, bacterial